ncbi:5799_t:CDS:2 [Funneliformis mosseae]|uniref:5799_t:CDS:1 n=1 Tax=Funneliformis mosseae TaxID=27381 RepID=A0A9N9ANS8_FUNMO|nr:5799_t:CDS:2 [Funneliformis mosseae]
MSQQKETAWLRWQEKVIPSFSEFIRSNVDFIARSSTQMSNFQRLEGAWTKHFNLSAKILNIEGNFQHCKHSSVRELQLGLLAAVTIDKEDWSCIAEKWHMNEDLPIDNVPFELECNLPNFTLDEIEESKNFTTHNSNVDKYPSCISPKKNENEEFTTDNIPFEFEYNFPYFTLDQLEESAIQDFNGDNNHENENFILNNVPCELEYDLTNSLLE